MMKRWLRIVLAVFVVGVLLLVGAAWYFSSVLLYPRPPRCAKDTFYYCGDPAKQGLSFTEVSFRTSDGLTLRGWWIPAPGVRRAIVLAHGRGADRREGMRYAKVLHRSRFHLLTFDFRHCGKSEGSFNSMGYHEQKDIKAAVDYLKKAKKVDRVGLFGFSLGASTGILAMAQDRRIQAGVFEGAFSSTPGIISERGQEQYHLPYYPLLPLVFWLYEWRGELELKTLRPDKAIAKIAPRPVYLIHGKQDQAVPVHHARRLFAAAHKPKSLWIVPDGRHIDAWQKNRAKAEKTVSSFFQKHLSPATTSQATRQN